MCEAYSTYVSRTQSYDRVVQLYYEFSSKGTSHGYVRMHCASCGYQRIFRVAELFPAAEPSAVTLRKACPKCGHETPIRIPSPPSWDGPPSL